uniref:Transmembrane protein 59 like n=1 Tax=Accipiter nisus TaxID=211598 RepID=A0A8B9MB97_9AVES
MEPSAGLPDPEHHGKPRIGDAVAVPCRGPRAGSRDRPRAPAVAGPYLGQRLGRSPRGLRCRSGDGVVFPSGLELPPCRHPTLPALPQRVHGPPWVGAPASPEPARADARGDPRRRLGAPPYSAFPVSPIHGPPPYTLSPAHAGAHPAPSTPTEKGGPATVGVRRSHRAELGASSTLASSSSLQDAVLNACYRGCRLFSICHFVDASAELNTTRAECEAACAEAYSNAEEQFGCVTGCRKQLPEVESRKEKVKAPSFSMFDLVSTFCNDIVSSAQSFISSTWTFYLQADDGKVVVFQVGVFQVGDALPPHPPRPNSHLVPCHKLVLFLWRGVVGCYRRSGLPRWILAACLFLSIMVMLWLSCASLVTAPEQHVKTQLGQEVGAAGMPPSWPRHPCPMPGAAQPAGL